MEKLEEVMNYPTKAEPKKATQELLLEEIYKVRVAMEALIEILRPTS